MAWRMTVRKTEKWPDIQDFSYPVLRSNLLSATRRRKVIMLYNLPVKRNYIKWIKWAMVPCDVMAELLFMWAISNLLNLQVWGPLAVQIIYPKSILDINHTQFCLFTGPLYIGVSSWKYSALYSVQNFRSIHSFDWLLWANESLQKFSLNKRLTIYIVMLLGGHSGQGRGYKTNLSCLLYSPLHDDVIKWK